MKRVLITGGSGLLGSAVAMQAVRDYETFLTYYTYPFRVPGAAGIIQADLADRGVFRGLIDGVQPEAIIHTAAFTNVDGCEVDRAQAERSNVVAVQLIAEEVAKIGARLIFISTDYVFDGKKSYYTEEDAVNPLSYYAETKVRAEEIIRSTCQSYCIVRTSLYGWNAQDKLSFSEWVIAGVSAGKKTPLFIDQYYSPILTNNLADALLELAAGRYTGTLHVTGAQRCSRFEVAECICDVFSLDKTCLSPVSRTSFRGPAARPADSSLSVSKARLILKTPLPDLQESITEMKRLQDEGYPALVKSYCIQEGIVQQ
ncbi:MAG: SDR family oxidoreductase [Candidatus Omnitrophica bacterium]|nr:SDR family oxidoreductase [Candidatus Omnitrophota bacterium]